MPPTPDEGRRMLVHPTVKMPPPETASNRPMLIGYDGSAEAEHAIDTAAALLEPMSAVVLNVSPRLTVGESFVSVATPFSGDAAFEGLNKSDALQLAEAGARLARAAGLHADARVCTATPTWEGLVQAADDIDAAVIVLGSRERRGAAELAEDNVSHDVAQHTRRPLLIVPQPARGQSGSAGPILIGYDGSEHARRAIEAAHALLRGREAVVLDAAPLRISVGYSEMPSDAPWVDAADPTLAYAGAQAGVEFAQQLGFHAVARTAAAHTTWRAVTDVADEVDASVIVVGSRGLRGAREVVEHSVSHDIATHARQPVLVVPPYGAGAEGDTVPGNSKA
jgi:nucleotide-binding universal stress UspA family protein